MRSMIAGATLVGACLLLGTTGGADIRCPGDCDGDAVVHIDELITAVKIALGARPLDACPGLDQQTGQVGVSDVVLAVSNSLGGCPFSHVDYVIFGSYKGMNGAGGLLFMDLVWAEVAVDHWTVRFSYSPEAFRGGPGEIQGSGTADFVRDDHLLIFDLQVHTANGDPFALTGSGIWYPPRLGEGIIRLPYFGSDVHLSAPGITLDFIGINPSVD